MIKFNKSTLTEIAGLGAGAVAGAYVSQKVLTKADGTYLVGAGATGKLISDLAPIAVGLLLQGQSNTFAKEAGKGMIAASIGGLIKKNVPTLGITGMDTLLGEVAAEPTGSSDRPLMGYSSSAYDITSGDAGEMDF